MFENKVNDRQSIAVIGSGIGGLTATWLLQQKYNVTLFEKHTSPGMGVFTVDYHNNNQHTRIDVPLRIVCEGYYDELLALFKEIGVDIQTTDHSAAFADTNNAILFHYTKLSLFGKTFTLPRLSSLSNPKALRLGFGMLRFSKLVERDFKHLTSLRETTFEEYLNNNKINRDLINTILLPILSVVCTCNYQAVLDYPADLIIGYLGCGVMKQGVIRAEKGVDDIVPRLIGNANIITNANIQKVEKINNKIGITTQQGDTHHFDQVVMATQAQQSAAMLSGFEEYHRLLTGIPFEASSMRVHTDTSFLPISRNKLSPVVYHLRSNSERPEVSVDLGKAFPNYSQQEPVFQTWHPIQKTDPEKTLVEAPFTRPTVTLSSRKLVTELQQLQKHKPQGVWFCGAYMADRIPLLEAAVQSAVSVAEALGVPAPWQTA